MSQFEAVAKVLGVYFDALHYCDVRKLETAFHPRAIYATADETPFLYRDMEEYSKVIAARESPSSRNERRRDIVDAIEFAGTNTAFARVRCSIGSKDFVDFLTLVRVEGNWRIIGKVFQVIENRGEDDAVR